MSTRLDELLSLSSFNERLYGRIKAFGVHINQEIHAELKALVEDLQRLTVKEEVVFTKIKDVTEADLRERTDALKLELTDCVSLKMSVENTGVFSKRAEKCLVFAATVDCCLNRLLPNEEHCFSHVFLDEAGYCSLIKGCTLFAYDTPVTFLGDHMQLPPICEMNDSIIKQNGNWPVFLWAQSAIYAESVFRKELSEAYTDYIKRRDIQLEYTKQYDLIMTYRFGPTLAAILRNEVYAKEFYAAGTHETELYYINAPKPMNSKDHESATECQQIEDYVVNNGSEQIGIITPYRAQYGMIKNRMRNYKELSDSLLTVHKSQGREWDTVLFSIADTTTHFFIDSLIKTSDGKKLVNTAVSRARKKLIIVCDYDYWITQKKQLICKILEKAKPYND